MREIFPKLELSEPGQEYPHMQKISPGGLPVSSINSEHMKHIYTHIRTHIYIGAEPGGAGGLSPPSYQTQGGGGGPSGGPGGLLKGGQGGS